VREKLTKWGKTLHEALRNAFNKHTVDPNLRKMILHGLVYAISAEPNNKEKDDPDDPEVDMRGVPLEYKHSRMDRTH
jgi:hypothetical protein